MASVWRTSQLFSFPIYVVVGIYRLRAFQRREVDRHMARMEREKRRDANWSTRLKRGGKTMNARRHTGMGTTKVSTMGPVSTDVRGTREALVRVPLVRIVRSRQMNSSFTLLFSLSQAVSSLEPSVAFLQH